MAARLYLPVKPGDGVGKLDVYSKTPAIARLDRAIRVAAQPSASRCAASMAK